MYDFEYKKHIQFLRGLSVIFVFLYHTNMSIFNKGYLGVDIFFVISGFVITQKIFQNYFLEKKINLIGFYSKRFKRIIPNLFFIIGITFVIYLIFGPPDLSLWNEMLSALFGISNLYYIVHDIGYFDNVFDDPLAHTWSLGVEEQFYLIYPFLIFIIYLFKNNKQFKLQIVLFIIFSLSILFFRKELETDPVIAFYLSPLRFWEFIFVTNYKCVSSQAMNLITNQEHAWTKYYPLSYITPWKMSEIFYAEYGAWADREYMTTSDDWSRVIESSHAFFCGLFSMGALFYKVVSKQNEEFLILMSVSMGAQLMNSILYIFNYIYQTHQVYSVNYNTASFPTGTGLIYRPFMYINLFWTLMPTITLCEYIWKYDNNFYYILNSFFISKLFFSYCLLVLEFPMIYAPRIWISEVFL